MERDEVGAASRPYQLLYQGAQFYLVGRSHERSAIRVFRLSRIRGKWATRPRRARFPAARQLRSPGLRQPHRLAVRRAVGVAQAWVGSRIAWQIERHFGRYGEIRQLDDAGAVRSGEAGCRADRWPAGEDDDPGDRLFLTPVRQLPQLIAWILGLGENARITGPPQLVDEAARARQPVVDATPASRRSPMS